MKWIVLAASLLFTPGAPTTIGPGNGLMTNLAGGSGAQTGSLLLIDGVSNLQLVDATDNLCLTGSTSC